MLDIVSDRVVATRRVVTRVNVLQAKRSQVMIHLERIAQDSKCLMITMVGLTGHRGNCTVAKLANRNWPEITSSRLFN